VKLAIIPARGGSKRIPYKNIRPFAGKPIIAYSIQLALESELFDKVIVSTDDEKIAGIARQYGAETPFIRPANLADDYIGTNAVVKHAISWFIEQSKEVQYACCIYATAPLLQVRYLQQGFEELNNSGKAFVFSVTTFSFPIQRAIKIKIDGSVEAFFPENSKKRSQDLEEAYHDAGQFYWGKAEAFLQGIEIFSESSLPVVLPRYLVQDIDTLEDWTRAELMYQAYISP